MRQYLSITLTMKVSQLCLQYSLVTILGLFCLSFVQGRDIENEATHLMLRSAIDKITILLEKTEELQESMKSACRDEVSSFKDFLMQDECSDGTHNCSEWATCTDGLGSYKCTCLPGFLGDGINCTDIDECQENRNLCGANEKCVNNQGAYECQCQDGFEEGSSGCQDIDECQGNRNLCGADKKCVNNQGAYECQCQDGFEEGSSGCQDIDECKEGLSDCNGPYTCLNTEGGFECQCLQPYELIDSACECHTPSALIEGLGCIKPLLTRMTWEVAKTQCESKGMRLLQEFTKDQMMNIAHNFEDVMIGWSLPWVGFKDKKWIGSGQVVSEDLSPIDLADGQCGVLRIVRGETVVPKDFPCDDREYALCQSVVAPREG